MANVPSEDQYQQVTAYLADLARQIEAFRDGAQNARALVESFRSMVELLTRLVGAVEGTLGEIPALVSAQGERLQTLLDAAAGGAASVEQRVQRCMASLDEAAGLTEQAAGRLSEAGAGVHDRLEKMLRQEVSLLHQGVLSVGQRLTELGGAISSEREEIRAEVLQIVGVVERGRARADELYQMLAQPGEALADAMLQKLELRAAELRELNARLLAEQGAETHRTLREVADGFKHMLAEQAARAAEATRQQQEQTLRWIAQLVQQHGQHDRQQLMAQLQPLLQSGAERVPDTAHLTETIRQALDAAEVRRIRALSEERAAMQEATRTLQEAARALEATRTAEASLAAMQRRRPGAPLFAAAALLLAVLAFAAGYALAAPGRTPAAERVATPNAAPAPAAPIPDTLYVVDATGRPDLVALFASRLQTQRVAFIARLEPARNGVAATSALYAPGGRKARGLRLAERLGLDSAKVHARPLRPGRTQMTLVLGKDFNTLSL